MSKVLSQIIRSLDTDDEVVLVREAIDNLRFIGDVGDTELHILERVLPHCTLDQLMHIEKSSKGRDLTPVTNKLWKNFYERKFGKVDQRMQEPTKDSSCRWKKLYEAKMKEFEEKARKIEDRMVQIYQKEKSQKQSRQVQFCEISSSSNNKKRSFEECQSHKDVNSSSKTLGVSGSGSNKKRSFETTIGSGFDYTRSKSKTLFDKARKEANRSLANKNHTVYKRNAISMS